MAAAVTAAAAAAVTGAAQAVGYEAEPTAAEATVAAAAAEAASRRSNTLRNYTRENQRALWRTCTSDSRRNTLRSGKSSHSRHGWVAIPVPSLRRAAALRRALPLRLAMLDGGEPASVRRKRALRLYPV